MHPCADVRAFYDTCFVPQWIYGLDYMILGMNGKIMAPGFEVSMVLYVLQSSVSCPRGLSIAFYSL